MVPTLILGHNGYLGSFLHQSIDADVLERRGVYRTGKKYDRIINCIGKVSLEYCEKHPSDSYQSNVQIVKDIIDIYPHAHIINFSSYYVYDDDGLCTEESNITTDYVYCRHKLESEELVTAANGLNFRIGKLFGSKQSSEFKKLTEHIIDNDIVDLDTVTFNPTSVFQVLDAIKHCKSLHGVYNLSNKGTCTHYEYGRYINSLLGNSKTVNRTDKINRMFSSYGKFAMDTSKIAKHLVLRDWKDDLRCIV